MSDGLGSVTEALNQTGTATGAQLYSPYGGVRYSSGTLPTAKGFTGQYADGSTGLDYYGARYYDPLLGQFTSPDTVNDGLNRYGYVKGNPETFADPTGHMLDSGASLGGLANVCWLPVLCPPSPPQTCTDLERCGSGGGSSGGGSSGGGSSGGGNSGGGCHSVSTCGGGQKCQSLSQCSGVQHPEVGRPCDDDQACFLGNQPNGLFHFLPDGAGTNAVSLVLNGKRGIEWFLNYFDRFTSNVDNAFGDLINEFSALAAGLGALATIMGAAVGFIAGPPGMAAGAAAGIAVGSAVSGLLIATSIAQYQSQQTAFDTMAADFKTQLRDLEAGQVRRCL